MNQHIQKAPLIPAASINRLRAGECVIHSPGFNFRPYKLRIRLNQRDTKKRKLAQKVWRDESLPYLVKRNERKLNLEWEMDERSVWAESILPTPEELEAVKQVEGRHAA